MLSLDVDGSQVMMHLYHLAMAYLLAFPIDWDREKRARHFGLWCGKTINRPRKRAHSGDRPPWRWIG